MNLKKFDNKSILITGASSGLGREVSRVFSNSKTKLILVARREDKLLELKEELERRNLCEVFVIIQDLTVDNGASIVYDKVLELGLSIDILINNAGIAFSDEFLDIPLDNYNNLIDLNIKAMISLTYKFLPKMVEKKSGMILNISSVLGVLPIPDMAVYGGSKAFVLSFSEALWKEYRKYGISVTTLVSVGIDTEFFTRVKRNKFVYVPVQRPEIVAKKAINALSKKKRLAYTGIIYSFLLHFRRILPQRLVIWMMDLFYDPNRE
ncbi:MAG: SDR family NAD(P)-dependent oxidoreductase [Candidatus Hodarchaeales archaeon]|jgi:short-subunit dehydrogenase